ncbi:DEAD-domain-containing protein, partial [Wilcoxina mikolae CBS 423.85]
MAEGGMFLNFDTPDAFLSSSKSISTFKGRWTERLKAKRAQSHHQKKFSNHRTPKISTALTTSKGDAAPGELRKVRGRTPTTPTDSSLKRKFVRESFNTKPPPGADGTFVSSLWTCNPESFYKTAATQPTETGETQVPSNAPLSDVSLTFTTLGISPILANHLATKLMLNAPTAIQCSAIPELISGISDAFIQAETGSGKTLTYLLPILDRIMRMDATSRQSGLFAIIIVPTRELSKQIYTVLQTLIHCKNGPHWIVPGLVTGGEKKKSEKSRLRKGMNILVATPGRLLDHLQNTTVLKVDKVRWLVLDEGDRLMELGFEEDIGKILDILNAQSKLSEHVYANDSMPKKRVTILCSATMKTNVQKLGEISLKEARYIKVEKSKKETKTDRTETFLAPTQLRQSYIVTPTKLRLVGLNAVLQHALVRPTAHSKIIVFFSCTDSVDFHFEVFTRNLPQTGAKKPEH